MKLEDLPERWRENLNNYLARPESVYANLSLADFENNLKLVFDDGSTIEFQNSFYLKDSELEEVAVFTEHCGYHIFPFCLEEIVTTNQGGNPIKLDSALTD